MPDDLDTPTGNMNIYVYHSGAWVGTVDYSAEDGTNYTGRDWPLVKAILAELAKHEVVPDEDSIKG